VTSGLEMNSGFSSISPFYRLPQSGLFTQDRAKLDGSVPQPWVSYLSSARVFSDAPIDTA